MKLFTKASSLFTAKPFALMALSMGLAFTAFGPASMPAFAKEKISVGSVNGETIYLDEVIQLAEELPDEYRSQPLSAYFPNLVSEITNTKLAAKAAMADDLQNNDVIVDAIRIATERILAEAYFGTEIRKTVNETEIQAAYDRFVADSDSREEVSARHILVEEEAAAIDLIEKLKGGADFATLAQEFSTGPSGPNGGDLGYFGRGQMVPDFEAATFALEIGTFTSAPVQTQFGYHVIKLEDKRLAPAPTLDQMRQQIASNLSQQALSRLIEELRSGATITERSFDDVRADAEAQRQ